MWKEKKKPRHSYDKARCLLIAATGGCRIYNISPHGCCSQAEWHHLKVLFFTINQKMTTPCLGQRWGERPAALGLELNSSHLRGICQCAFIVFDSTPTNYTGLYRAFLSHIHPQNVVTSFRKKLFDFILLDSENWDIVSSACWQFLLRTKHTYMSRNSHLCQGYWELWLWLCGCLKY